MKKEFLINLGDKEQIPLGQGRCFVVKGEEIAVFRTRSGDIYAIDNKCPHRQGPLSEGIIGNGIVVCPLHGHKFDLKTGKGLEGKECVRSYEVTMQSNNMLLSYPVDALKFSQT